MDEIINLEKKVEMVRELLNEEINKSGDNLTSGKVLELSRELDVLLVEYQKKLNKD